jgi:hypothetical protein
LVLTETISGKLDIVMPQNATADRVSRPPAPGHGSDIEAAGAGGHFN